MRHQAASTFGAICPARDTGVALVMPDASTEAMQALLQELSTSLPPDRHAVLVMDRAGWHTGYRLVWPGQHHAAAPASLQSRTEPQSSGSG